MSSSTQQRKLSSASSHARTVSPAVVAELEPSDEWKAALRTRISMELNFMVSDAKASLEADIKQNPEEKERLMEEHKGVIEGIKTLANEEFNTQLGQERLARRWSNGLSVPPGWEEALGRQQAGIMDNIQGKKGDEQDDTTASSREIHNDGEPNEEPPALVPSTYIQPDPPVVVSPPRESQLRSSDPFPQPAAMPRARSQSRSSAIPSPSPQRERTPSATGSIEIPSIPNPTPSPKPPPQLWTPPPASSPGPIVRQTPSLTSLRTAAPPASLSFHPVQEQPDRESSSATSSSSAGSSADDDDETESAEDESDDQESDAYPQTPSMRRPKPRLDIGYEQGHPTPPNPNLATKPGRSLLSASKPHGEGLMSKTFAAAMAPQSNSQRHSSHEQFPPDDHERYVPRNPTRKSSRSHIPPHQYTEPSRYVPDSYPHTTSPIPLEPHPGHFSNTPHVTASSYHPPFYPAPPPHTAGPMNYHQHQQPYDDYGPPPQSAPVFYPSSHYDERQMPPHLDAQYSPYPGSSPPGVFRDPNRRLQRQTSQGAFQAQYAPNTRGMTVEEPARYHETWDAQRGQPGWTEEYSSSPVSVKRRSSKASSHSQQSLRFRREYPEPSYSQWAPSHSPPQRGYAQDSGMQYARKGSFGGPDRDSGYSDGSDNADSESEGDAERERLYRREQEVKQKQEEAARKEEEARLAQEEAQRIKEAAERRERELQKSQEDARRKEAELQLRAKEARKKEKEAKKKEEEAKKREEHAQRITEESRRREAQIREREEQLRRREEELARKEKEKAEEEEEQRRKEEEQRRREEEQRRWEEEQHRREEEQRRREEEQRRWEEEQRRREEGKRRREEELAKERQREAEELDRLRRKQEAEDEALKRRKEVEEQERRLQRLRDEHAKAEAQRKEEERKRLIEEQEREQRLLEEEARRIQEEQEEQEEQQRREIERQVEQDRQAALALADLERAKMRREAQERDAASVPWTARDQDKRSHTGSYTGSHTGLHTSQVDREQQRAEEERDRRFAEQQREEEKRQLEFQRREQEILQRKRATQDGNGGTPPLASPINSARPPSAAGGGGGGAAWTTWTTGSPGPGHRPTGSTPKPPLSQPSVGSSSSPEAEWQKRQAEQAQQQQSRFQAEQQRLEQDRLSQAARAGRTLMTRDEFFSLVERHERLWAKLLHSHTTGDSRDELRWDEFPWPLLKPPASVDDITPQEIAKYVLSPHFDSLPMSSASSVSSQKSEKDRIRDNVRKWHPDRFDTKILPRVREADRERVQEAAGVVARSLTDFLSKNHGGKPFG